MPSNANDVAAAVLDHVGPVEATCLQKLVYCSQSWHLALVDEPLFRDTIQAWRDGPVTPTLWDQHRGDRVVGRWPAGDPARLTAIGAKVVDLVCQVYGGLSGDDLSELTHNEEPWRAARGGLPDDRPSKAVITPEAMKTYYRQRSFAGLGVADLVSGGFHGFPQPDMDAAERRSILAGIRADARQTEPGEPGLPEPIGTAFTGAGGSGSEPRVQTRLNRERPHRGTAAHQR